MKCSECKTDIDIGICAGCLAAAMEETQDVTANVLQEEAPQTPELIRGYADRGRIMATMTPETVAELLELAERIEQGEPVS